MSGFEPESFDNSNVLASTPLAQSGRKLFAVSVTQKAWEGFEPSMSNKNRQRFLKNNFAVKITVMIRFS